MKIECSTERTAKANSPRQEHAWHVEGTAESDSVDGGNSGQEARKRIMDLRTGPHTQMTCCNVLSKDDQVPSGCYPENSLEGKGRSRPAAELTVIQNMVAAVEAARRD